MYDLILNMFSLVQDVEHIPPQNKLLGTYLTSSVQWNRWDKKAANNLPISYLLKRARGTPDSGTLPSRSILRYASCMCLNFLSETFHARLNSDMGLTSAATVPRHLGIHPTLDEQHALYLQFLRQRSWQFLPWWKVQAFWCFQLEFLKSAKQII